MKKTFAWLLCLLLVSLLAPMGALAAAGDVTVTIEMSEPQDRYLFFDMGSLVESHPDLVEAFFYDPENAVVEWSNNVLEPTGFDYDEETGGWRWPMAFRPDPDRNASYWCKITLNGRTLTVFFKVVDSYLVIKPLTGTPAVYTETDESGYERYTINVREGEPFVVNCNDLLTEKAKQKGYRLAYSWSYSYVGEEDVEIGTERTLRRTAAKLDPERFYCARVAVMDGDVELEAYHHFFNVKIISDDSPTPTVPKTGDSATPWLWTVVALAAMGCVVALSMRKHGKQNG